MCTVREQRCRYEQLRRIFEVPYALIIGKLTFRDGRTVKLRTRFKGTTSGKAVGRFLVLMAFLCSVGQIELA